MPKLVEAFNAKGEDKAELQIVPVNELVQKYAIAAAGGIATRCPFSRLDFYALFRSGPDSSRT